jgi:hypothetical protein
VAYGNRYGGGFQPSIEDELGRMVRQVVDALTLRTARNTIDQDYRHKHKRRIAGKVPYEDLPPTWYQARVARLEVQREPPYDKPGRGIITPDKKVFKDVENLLKAGPAPKPPRQEALVRDARGRDPEIQAKELGFFR